MADTRTWLELVTALVPLPPLIAFGLIVLWLNRWKRLSHSVAIGAMALSFGLAQWVCWTAFFQGGEALRTDPIAAQVAWLTVGDLSLRMGILVDPLTVVTLFFVSTICLAIFIYSVGYMHGDPRYSRFFAYISLFAAGMLGLTVADNLLMLFVFWELMGLCSYLLIGFWFEQPSAYRAAIKAFLVTRIGDVVMLLGVLYLYKEAGGLQFDLLRDVDMLGRLAATPSLIPGLSVAAAVGLFLFVGTVGKSAQFPLHVWLSDAMEGPTPVSAMIHAATMVSAGVYLVLRMFPLMRAGLSGTVDSPPMVAMTWVGTFTALFAATIAVAQTDIKRVLAYSTISQLAYMIAAAGIGAFAAATFHLITHAFFKALLFLGAGSVIVGAHHEQDMRKMGGLRARMPWTFWTFLIGGLALVGFPVVTAGFWSKDAILAHAWLHRPAVFWALTFGAMLTGFYTARQIGLVFLGRPRSEHAANAHETPWSMRGPLVVLAFFAVGLGLIGIPKGFPLLGSLIGGNRLEMFLAVGAEGGEEAFHLLPLLISASAALGGLLIGWWIYRVPLAANQVDPLVRLLGPLYRWLENGYFVDRLYERLFIRPTLRLAWVSYHWLDRTVLDGALHGLARGVYALAGLSLSFDRAVINAGVDRLTDGLGRSAAEGVREVQTGRVQEYLLQALVILAGAVGIYIAFFA